MCSWRYAARQMGAFNRRWLCPLCAPSGHDLILRQSLELPSKIGKCHLNYTLTSSYTLLTSYIFIVTEQSIESYHDITMRYTGAPALRAPTRQLRRSDGQGVGRPRAQRFDPATRTVGSPRPAAVDEVVVAPDGSWRPKGEEHLAVELESPATPQRRRASLKESQKP